MLIVSLVAFKLVMQLNPATEGNETSCFLYNWTFVRCFFQETVEGEKEKCSLFL